MTTTLFLCGDVMTGRGIDQILPHPGDPVLRESVVTDANTYVALAERVNGTIPRPVPFEWPWGEALSVLEEAAPDARLINLETAVTTSGDFAPGKAVHYRMNPANIGCLTVARPDVCVLANNHVLDFGVRGLTETVQTLDDSGLVHVGAGHSKAEACCAAVLRGGVAAVAAGSRSSGVPLSWAATDDRAGVAYLGSLSDATCDELAAQALSSRGADEVTVVSLHWGSNWGYDIDDAAIRFAHRLIDAGIDVVYGHSSHHPRPIEVYRGRLIFYGCGDLINDYEGIEPYRNFRDDLRLLYFATFDGGELQQLRMVPLRARRMRLERADRDDSEWLRATLEDASAPFGTRIRYEDDALVL